MSHSLYTCLWFDKNGPEAAEFYLSLFQESKLISKNNFVQLLDLNGTKLMCLNGGPHYKHTPSASLFITCDTKEEIDFLWSKLSNNGTVLMELGSYDWSPHYGWCQDEFGIYWQLYQGKFEEVNQKIVPSYLFTGERFKQAEAALNHYTSIFQSHKIDGIMRFENTQSEIDGAVMHAQFALNQSVFMVMDGPGEHKHTFSPALSVVVECDTQDEIDYYWEKLGEGGTYNQCGWLDDKFGISWQIVPKILGQLMSNPEKAQRVSAAFMQMSKFIIADLENA